MGGINDIEKALALLRRRPQAARIFMRASVQEIVNVARARGITIHGED